MKKLKLKDRYNACPYFFMDMSNRQKVVDILKDYYGEDRVDDQGAYVLIYWPEVTVTNESDRSTDIKELYARIVVNTNGTLEGTFRLNRAEYSCTEWFNNYMHSHVRSINKHFPGNFSDSCLGSGPIRDTMAYLNTNFDEEFWTMFSLELDKYVHTESLNGGPYHRMEQMNRLPETKVNEINVHLISTSLYAQFISDVTLTNILREFIVYVIRRKPFRFSFNDRYCIADSNYNIVVKLSNLFIEWLNGIPDDSRKLYIKNYMLTNSYLGSYKAYEGKINRFEKVVHSYDTYRSKNGTPLWTFKGRLLYLKITGIPEKDDEVPAINDPFLSTLLKPELALHIANKLLNVINYQYGRTETQGLRPDKKIYYLSSYNTDGSGTEDSSSVF